jgi:hypothetical protein
MRFEAYFLPGFATTVALQRFGEGEAEIVYPEIEPPQIAAVCARLRTAAARARLVTVHDRIDAVAGAIQQVTAPHGTSHQLAMTLLQQTAGYSAEMVREVLAQISVSWTRAALERLVRAELGAAERLEQFVHDPVTGRRTMAIGPELVAHIFSGNVPGVAVESLIRALLVKSASFGKLAADEPVLPILFARCLPAELRDTIALTHWPGGTDPLERALFAEADAIVVYGGADAVESVRRRATAGQRLIVHGPRFSMGIVGPEAATAAHDDGLARSIARAVALFDQQGCVSPHVVYVVGDYENALKLGRAVAGQLETMQAQLPRGRLYDSEAVALHEARAQAEFSGIAGQRTELFSDVTGSFSVVVADDDGFVPSCLNRFVYIKPLSSVQRLIDLLNPVRSLLQSVAIAGFDARQSAELAVQLGRLGASRITTFESLPWPPLDWHHDGSHPLGELLRWVDWETT